LIALEDGRYNMPLTEDRNEVVQKLEQFYERLHKITQQGAQSLKKKWQNQ
jgi:hypothetical protein